MRTHLGDWIDPATKPALNEDIASQFGVQTEGVISPGEDMVSGPSSQLRDELTRSVASLRAFAMTLCGNSARADDLAQEALVKAWDKLALFEEGTNVKAWLFTILRNTFYLEQRQRKREVEDADGTL